MTDILIMREDGKLLGRSYQYGREKLIWLDRDGQDQGFGNFQVFSFIQINDDLARNIATMLVRTIVQNTNDLANTRCGNNWIVSDLKTVLCQPLTICAYESVRKYLPVASLTKSDIASGLARLSIVNNFISCHVAHDLLDGTYSDDMEYGESIWMDVESPDKETVSFYEKLENLPTFQFFQEDHTCFKGSIEDMTFIKMISPSHITDSLVIFGEEEKYLTKRVMELVID